jgi:hypothetical protein
VRAFTGFLRRNEWTLSVDDTDSPVLVTVRALLVDGLHCAPFDQHRDGTHELRDAGLDEAAWRTWVNNLLAAWDRFGLATAAFEEMNSAHLTDLTSMAQVLETPGSLCPGSSALQHRLNMLWAEFQREMNETKARWLSNPTELFDRMPPGGLWRDLLPNQKKLATLTVYRVDYPYPAAAMVIPPTTCLVASGPDGQAFGRTVIEAARSLAALADVG